MPHRQKTSTQSDTSQLNELNQIRTQLKALAHVTNNQATSISNINQTLNNINSQLPEIEVDNNIVQLSNSNIAIDRVVASLDAFKTAIYRTSYINKLITDMSSTILISSDYNDKLKPIVEKKFIENEEYFWIWETAITNSELPTARDLFDFKRFNFLTGQTIYNIQNTATYPDLSELTHTYLQTSSAKLQNLVNSNPTSKLLNLFLITPWVNGLKLGMIIFRKDVTNINKWIGIGSGVNLTNYLPNTNNVTAFSPEYMNLINTIQSTIANLNSNFTLSSNEDIWEFGNPTKFNSLKCINSKLYPALWNGQYISQCFIPGSNENMPQIMLNIINDIFYNYPELYDGQIAITTYQIEGIHYTSIVKIMIIGGKTYFIQKQLSINSFFSPSLQVTGDTVIAGSLNVETYTGESLIETDNVNKITCFHDKVGINQDPFEVNALLDIDNLSVKKIVDIVDNLAFISLNSYEIISEINKMSSITGASLSNIFNISLNGALKDYRNDCVVFKSPIKNVIVPSDIIFLYNLPDVNGAFSSTQFTTESFNKIKQIVNEVNRMPDERGNNPNFIFSFVELLNDTKFNYLTSLRAIIKGDVMYFVMTFNDVEDFMNDKSYKVNFTNVINVLSSLNRLLNFGALVVSNTGIQTQLFDGNSVDSFSKYINNSEFRDRFGLKGKYFFMHKIPKTSEEYKSGNFERQTTFNESLTYWNIKNPDELFLVGKETTSRNIQDKIMEYYNNYYNINKIGQNFVVKYSWLNGYKISFGNIINISGQHYLLGSGIDLNEYIDQSIISKGDSTFSGDFMVSDKNNNPIFKVDTVNKNIANLYKVAIGKDTPESTLDIKDSGITDILTLVKNAEKTINKTNSLLAILRNYNFNNPDVQKDFSNNVLNTYTQTNDDYFAIMEIDDTTLNSRNIIHRYHWLYPEWNNTKIGQIDDPNNKKIIDTAIQVWSDILDNSLIFDGAVVIKQYVGTFGVKRTRYNFFRNSINHKLYALGNGVNLQNYNLRINTNINIQNYFNCVTAYSLYLQQIVINKTNISANNMINLLKSKDIINTQAYLYPLQPDSIVEYAIDSYNYYNTSISMLNYNLLQNTLSPINTIKISDMSNVLQINEKSKRLSFLISLYDNYKSTTDGSLNLYNGYYGVLHFEDLYNDYFSVFYCYTDASAVLKIISMEFGINDYIKPTLDVEGDARIKGDFIVYNKKTKQQYVSVDPEIKFVGINTDERLVNYKYDNSTTIQNAQYLTNHHVYIKNDRYPNLVCERVQENVNDLTTSNYSNSKTFSAATVKRKSELYTFTNMYDNAVELQRRINNQETLYKTGSLDTKAIYGADISFEISDSTNVTKEIGNIQMGIESLDRLNNIKAGFGVKVLDVNPSGTSSVERNIMYVSNDGVLHINQIMLGGKILKVVNGVLKWGEQNVNLSA